MRQTRTSLVVITVLALPFVASAQETPTTLDGAQTATGSSLPTGPIPLPIVAPGCPLSNLGRTAQQVWADHLDALQKGDFERAMCDYAWDARVLMPGTVLRGYDQVRAGFLGFNQMVGFALPTITSVTIDGEVVFSTFTLDSPVAAIPDGSDTFVVRFGLIHYQTVHASLIFKAAQ